MPNQSCWAICLSLKLEIPTYINDDNRFYVIHLLFSMYGKIH